jgi:hypothetical protein
VVTEMLFAANRDVKDRTLKNLEFSFMVEQIANKKG